MSGIQFELQERFKSQTISEKFFQEVERLSESIGGWWITVVYFVVLIWLLDLDISVATKFYSLLSFAVVISVAVSSILNPLIGKSLSETLFMGVYQDFVPYLVGSVIVGEVASVILSFSVVSFSSFSWTIKLLFVLLVLSFSLLWVIVNFISIVKKEKVLFWAYVYSCGFSLLWTFFLYQPKLSFALLQLIVSFSLVAFFLFFYLIKSYHRGKIRPSFSFLKFLEQKSYYIAFYFYSMGIWIDKVVFWFHPKTSNSIDAVFKFSFYDVNFFIAFSIFSISQFLIYRRFRDLFYQPYHEFTNILVYNGTFFDLSQRKEKLIMGYKKIISYICYYYAPFSVAVYLLLYSWVKTKGVGLDMQVFRFLLFGTFFLAILSFNYIVLQYLNYYKTLAFSCFLFFSLNWLLSELIIDMGLVSFYGAGFTVSALIASLFSIGAIHHILGSWEYRIFKEST